MVGWEDGSKTYEPLSQMIADDPVTCALYAKEQGLLDKTGWKWLKGIARRDKKMIRMLNQSRLRSFRRAPYTRMDFVYLGLQKKPLRLIRKMVTHDGRMQFH